MVKQKKIKRSAKKIAEHFTERVGGVMNHMEFFAQLFVDYLNRRYKIQKRTDEVKNIFLTSLFALKKEFMKTIVESIFLFTGLLALIIGSIMFISKIVKIEYVLLIYGLFVTIGVLLKMRLKV